MATIEELKEAREALTTEEGYAAGCRCKYCKAVDAVLPLIDAEIERQGVTDEDVAEAIERVNEQINTLADIIDELVEEQGEEAMVRDVKEAWRTEITCLAALQAYRPVEVTDKDVAFAIEELEEVNNSLKLSRDGQKELGDEKEVSGFDDWIFANELAIKVLKAYRPEREPCGWCENSMRNTMGYIQYGCYRLDASCWNFCPVCGRKLEKAVAI